MTLDKLSYVYHYTKPNKLLDVGGKITSEVLNPYCIREEFLKRDYEYHCIDKCDDIDKFNVRRCDIEEEKMPYKDSSFDTVLLMDVLEHLGRNPVHALQECYRVLRYNGKFIISTPNFFSPIKVIFFISTLKHYDFHTLLNHEERERGYTPHIRIYTKREVKDLLRYVGFKIIHYQLLHRRDDMFFVCTKK